MAERGKRQKVSRIWGKNGSWGWSCKDQFMARMRSMYQKSLLMPNTPLIPKARHKNSWNIKKMKLMFWGTIFGIGYDGYSKFRPGGLDELPVALMPT